MNYYERLGVAMNATHEDIQKAFKQAARKAHPDVNKSPDAEETFKAISEAYDTLRDPAKRSQYDVSLRPAARPGVSHPSGIPGMEFFDDILNAVTEIVPVAVPIRNAYQGCVLRVPLKGGSVQVKIPAKVEAGQKIRIMTPTGPVFLEMKLKRDESFYMEDGVLHTTVDVTPWEVALGVKVPVATLDGVIDLKASATVTQCKGRGYPKGRKPGDLHVHMNLCVPEKFSEEEKSLYTQLAGLSLFRPTNGRVH